MIASRRSAFARQRARDTEVRGPNASRGLRSSPRKRRAEPRLDSADSSALGSSEQNARRLVVTRLVVSARASATSSFGRDESRSANAIEEERRLDHGRVTHAPGLVPVRRFVLQKSSGRLRAQRSGPSAAFGSKARTLASDERERGLGARAAHPSVGSSSSVTSRRASDAIESARQSGRCFERGAIHFT